MVLAPSLPLLLLRELSQAALGQVASQIDFHGSFLHDCLTLISRDIMLDGVLKCLTLAHDTVFHFPA